jgi:hypothetical protein
VGIIPSIKTLGISFSLGSTALAETPVKSSNTDLSNLVSSMA